MVVEETPKEKKTFTYPSFSLAVSALAMANGRYNSDCTNNRKEKFSNPVSKQESFEQLCMVSSKHFQKEEHLRK